MKTGAVVLAAGSSSRLGEAKQLVRLGGERLLERAVRIALEAGCEPVVVVLGARAEQIKAACHLRGAVVLRQPGWAEGMAASIRLGIETLQNEVDAAVVLGCDQPAVGAAHLRALMELAGADSDRPAGRVVASAYAGKRGIPACFPADVFEELKRLRGDKGARDLLQMAHAVDLPDGELDIDTVEALAEARVRYGQGAT